MRRSQLITESYKLRDRIHDRVALSDREAHQFLPRIVVPVNPERHDLIIANMRLNLGCGAALRWPIAVGGRLVR
jgi:hypothetical protein